MRLKHLFLRTFGELHDAHGRWAAVCMAALSLLLPLAPVAVPPLILLTGVLLIARYRKTANMRTWLQEPALLTPIAFFLLYMIGLAWTNDFGYAFFDLEIKLPLALIPLAVLHTPRHARSGGRAMLSLFIAGNVLAVLACVAMIPVHLLMGRGDLSSQLFGSDLSLFLHPGYFALYLCIALAAVLFGAVRPPGSAGSLVPAILVLGIVLTGSKAGWLSLALLLLTTALWRRRGPALWLLLAALPLAASTLALSPNLRERLQEVWRAMNDNELHPDATTSSEVRKLAWHSAVQVTEREWPWGAGTGDVKNLLMEQHAANAYTHLVKERINAHQQYLQTAATLGLPGAIAIAALILVPLWAAWRKRNWAAGAFLLLSAINWAVESMLEVKAGTDIHAWAIMAFAFMRAQRSSAA